MSLIDIESSWEIGYLDKSEPDLDLLFIEYFIKEILGENKEDCNETNSRESMERLEKS
jgi:hypothetical protein